ncbi:Protein-L-isoaspartate O-methyltransferase [Defluviimonas aquaemixtae]|uniref:Protein-L-isoaspartate O-methyltransferase n=1 Tax=Albidovulum aquaemixtae TaxID=1542388 RepID=A0A2R8B448_9RHOB|nr:FkbM family methyltransferase [Defluviimonas aquaemixtae]SPH17389.1 Protein-L-isoaspartate O-methyltransferase [Defluviimonas aquaemixtae]
MAGTSAEVRPIVATCKGIEVPEAPHFGPGMIRSMGEGRYEGKEIQTGLAVIPEGARILEMGAGSGIVGAVLAKNCKAEKVVAIEANPELIEHIRHLYTHNGLDRVMSVRHGVVFTAPEPPATVEFFLRGNFLGSGLKVVKNPERARPVTVPVLPYGALKAEFPHDVIVMDIEGAELDFLRHADLTGVNTIILEVHRDIYGREGMREIRRLFADAGFALDEEHSKVGVHAYRRAG